MNKNNNIRECLEDSFFRIKDIAFQGIDYRPLIDKVAPLLEDKNSLDALYVTDDWFNQIWDSRGEENTSDLSELFTSIYKKIINDNISQYKMETKTINEQIEIMKAYAEGKKIEYKAYDSFSKWETVTNPDLQFNWSTFNYRIKKEPKTRPMNIEEIVNYLITHGGYVKLQVKDKKGNCRNSLHQVKNIIFDNKQPLEIENSVGDTLTYSEQTFIKKFIKLDGTKFEVKENENN